MSEPYQVNQQKQKLIKIVRLNLELDSILGQAVTLNNNPTSTNVNQSRGFDGAAEADQENRLLGSIAVTVTDVLPNDLLVIRGEKWMTLTNGEEFIRLSGLIRPDDVASNNTISSTKVADARISYSGTGDLASVNEQGWLLKVFNSGLCAILINSFGGVMFNKAGLDNFDMLFINVYSSAC